MYSNKMIIKVDLVMNYLIKATLNLLRILQQVEIIVYDSSLVYKFSTFTIKEIEITPYITMNIWNYSSSATVREYGKTTDQIKKSLHWVAHRERTWKTEKNEKVTANERPIWNSSLISMRHQLLKTEMLFAKLRSC